MPRISIHGQYGLVEYESIVPFEQLLDASFSCFFFFFFLQLYVPTKPGRVGQFPKTLYSENATVFDFVINNFDYSNISSTDGGSKCGRLVLEMQLVHGLLKNRTRTRTFSRDDEYTPSVFLTFNQLFGEKGPLQGFLQWKPISYLGHERKSTQSQQAIVKDGDQIRLDKMSPGLVTALYTNESDAGIIQPIYMVFGTNGDDNNPNPTYVSW